MRERLGPDFIIIYRLSMLDLVEQGSSWEQVGLSSLSIANGLSGGAPCEGD